MNTKVTFNLIAIISTGIIKPFDVLVWGGYVFILLQCFLGLLVFSFAFPELNIKASSGLISIIGFVTGEPFKIQTKQLILAFCSQNF